MHKKTNKRLREGRDLQQSLLQFWNNGLGCLTLNPDLRVAFPRNHKSPPKKLNFRKRFRNNDDL
jgi:hypothetical protein